MRSNYFDVSIVPAFLDQVLNIQLDRTEWGKVLSQAVEKIYSEKATESGTDSWVEAEVGCGLEPDSFSVASSSQFAGGAASAASTPRSSVCDSVSVSAAASVSERDAMRIKDLENQLEQVQMAAWLS